jgi:hypothetical protein
MRVGVVGIIIVGSLVFSPFLRPWSSGVEQVVESNFNQSERILELALSRALPECSAKIQEYYLKHTLGNLKLDYSPDPVAIKSCNAEVLNVPDSGPDQGKIMKHPRTLRQLLPPYYENNVQSNITSNDSEKPYSLAFLILLHGEQTPLVIDRLVSKLQRPHHRLLMHVDSKAPATLHSHAADIASRFPHSVAVLQPARTVNWGGPSMLQVPYLSSLPFQLHSECAHTSMCGV